MTRKTLETSLQLPQKSKGQRTQQLKPSRSNPQQAAATMSCPSPVNQPKNDDGTTRPIKSNKRCFCCKGCGYLIANCPYVVSQPKNPIRSTRTMSPGLERGISPDFEQQKKSIQYFGNGRVNLMHAQEASGAPDVVVGKFPR